MKEYEDFGPRMINYRMGFEPSFFVICLRSIIIVQNAFSLAIACMLPQINTFLLYKIA